MTKPESSSRPSETRYSSHSRSQRSPHFSLVQTRRRNGPRRILFFEDRHYAAQGAQKLLIQLAVFARDLGIDVTVASTRDGAFLELARSEGLAVLEVGVPEQLDVFEGSLLGPGMRLKTLAGLTRQNLALARRIRRGRYDVVWASAMRPMMSLLLASVVSRTTMVWQIMGSGYFRGINELASLAADRIVLIAEGLRPTSGVWYQQRWIERKSFVVPTGISVPSDLSDTKPLVRQRFNLSPESEKLVWIVSIGAHIAEKGHLDVLRAVEMLPQNLKRQTLVLIGGPPIEGPYRDELLIAADASDAKVLVEGWVDDVDLWLRAADIYVVASEREGMPLTLIEAMQRGASAVAYPVGGVPELVTDQQTGLLVESGSVVGLARALATLVGEPDLRKSLAANAQRSVMSSHTDESMRERFKLVIASLFPEIELERDQ